jgi:hypothetical protein
MMAERLSVGDFERSGGFEKPRIFQFESSEDFEGMVLSQIMTDGDRWVFRIRRWKNAKGGWTLWRMDTDNVDEMTREIEAHVLAIKRGEFPEEGPKGYDT